MLRYDVVDVFTERPFAGNPLAVVRGAADLSAAQLQAIASEFNLSETAFPTEPTSAEREAGADYRVRIFTPAAELPFAGHPSIGTAWLLHDDGLLRAGLVGQACGAGVVTLQVPAADGRVELSARPHRHPVPLHDAHLLAAVGLTEADAAGQGRVAGCGLDFGYLPVGADALGRAVPSAPEVSAVGDRAGHGPLAGLCLFCVEADSRPLRVRARVFCPEVGVAEDAATGSAALGLGLVLAEAGLLSAEGGRERYVVRQGVEMGRPSRLHGRVTFTGRAVELCHVAGNVVRVAAGQIAVPAAD